MFPFMKPKGFKSRSPSILFIKIPNSGIKIPEPSPLVVVALTTFSYLSITLICVVEPKSELLKFLLLNFHY